MRIIYSVLFPVFIVVFMPINVKADSNFELLDKAKESMDDEYDEWNTDFYIDHYGMLKLVFSEMDSYGKFNVCVTNENEDDIFDKTFRIGYEDYVCKIMIPEGTYSITVTSYENNSWFYLKLYFKETSNVTYNALAKAAKSKAGKTIIFDTIDAGRHGRLYGGRLVSNDDSKIKSELMAYVWTVQPYIDIQKKNGSVYTKLKFESIDTVVSAYPYDMYYNKMVFTSRKYKLVFDMDDVNEKEKYDYSDMIYTTKCTSITTVSTNEKIREGDLRRLVKLLEDKDSRIKVQNGDGGYTYVYLSDACCKNWVRMIKIYQKLLKLYK